MKVTYFCFHCGTVAGPLLWGRVCWMCGRPVDVLPAAETQECKEEHDAHAESQEG